MHLVGEVVHHHARVHLNGEEVLRVAPHRLPGSMGRARGGVNGRGQRVRQWTVREKLAAKKVPCRAAASHNNGAHYLPAAGG